MKMAITFQQHIVQEQTRLAGSSMEVQWMLSGITFASKMITAQVRCAGLVDILGSVSSVNVQGEVQ